MNMCHHSSNFLPFSTAFVLSNSPLAVQFRPFLPFCLNHSLPGLSLKTRESCQLLIVTLPIGFSLCREPTLRLETAPSLNWITRRSLLNAIYTGQLDISPTPFTSSLYNLNSSGSNCALCGLTIPHPSSADGQEQLHTFRLPSTTASFPGANVSLSNASSFTNGSGTIYLLCSS